MAFSLPLPLHLRRKLLLNLADLRCRAAHGFLDLQHRFLHQSWHAVDDGLAGGGFVEGEDVFHFLFAEAFLIEPHVDRFQLVPGEFFLHHADHAALHAGNGGLLFGGGLFALEGFLDAGVQVGVHLGAHAVQHLAGFGNAEELLDGGVGGRGGEGGGGAEEQGGGDAGEGAHAGDLYGCAMDR